MLSVWVAFQELFHANMHIYRLRKTFRWSDSHPMAALYLSCRSPAAGSWQLTSRLCPSLGKSTRGIRDNGSPMSPLTVQNAHSMWSHTIWHIVHLKKRRKVNSNDNGNDHGGGKGLNKQDWVLTLMTGLQQTTRSRLDPLHLSQAACFFL